MALPVKNISHLPSEKRGKIVNFLEHMNTFVIKRSLFWHFKVIIENLEAHIHIKEPNNSKCNHV